MLPQGSSGLHKYTLGYKLFQLCPLCRYVNDILMRYMFGRLADDRKSVFFYSFYFVAYRWNMQVDLDRDYNINTIYLF